MAQPLRFEVRLDNIRTTEVIQQSNEYPSIVLISNPASVIAVAGKLYSRCDSSFKGRNRVDIVTELSGSDLHVRCGEFIVHVPAQRAIVSTALNYSVKHTKTIEKAADSLWIFGSVSQIL